jgi:DNA gyrase subunit A
MRLVEERGSLVGALVCDIDDELYAVASNGVVIRTRVSELRSSGRDTMGVTVMNVGNGDTVVAVARAADSEDGEDGEAGVEPESDDVAGSPTEGADGEPGS